jgi:peptidoglycan hydrolase CwlO-like protein
MEQEKTLMSLEIEKYQKMTLTQEKEISEFHSQRRDLEAKLTEILKNYEEIKHVSDFKDTEKEQLEADLTKVNKSYKELRNQYADLQEAYDTLKKLIEQERMVYSEEATN